MERYEVILGPNSKQLWVYDNIRDEYIDPPAKVLEKLDADFEWNDWEGKQDALYQIVIQEPDWLYDEEYIYSAEEFEI